MVPETVSSVFFGPSPSLLPKALFRQGKLSTFQRGGDGPDLIGEVVADGEGDEVVAGRDHPLQKSTTKTIVAFGRT